MLYMVHIGICVYIFIYKCTCIWYSNDVNVYTNNWKYIWNKDLCERICFEKQGKGTLKFIHIFLYAFNAMRIDWQTSWNKNEEEKFE